MLRATTIAGGLLAVCLAFVSIAPAAEISGDYLEARTCDIYTGPCFANSEVGLTGHQAIMAWSIDEGEHNGVDLAGLKAVLAITASDTLGYGGGLVVNPEPIRSVLLVDESASEQEREALADFVRQRAGKVAGEVVRVAALPIEMTLDHVHLTASLTAGKEVKITTRAVGKAECCCTNEIVFYPPLTDVDNSAPAYALDGQFTGRGLGVSWSHPRSRSAFLATFAY